MKKQETSDTEDSMQKYTNLGSFFWPILLSSAVFFGTLWTNQALVSSRMQYLDSEIKKLSEYDLSINERIEKIDSDQKALLLDISIRLRDLEIKIAELQVRIIYAIDKNNNTQSSGQAEVSK
jgi:hypothetical protein